MNLEKDRLLRFVFPDYRVRGQIVQLGASWKSVAARHRRHERRELSPNLRQRLGELSAAGLLLSASLKYDGSLVLQIQGAGPVLLFVAECEHDGAWRSTVKLRDGARVMPDASLIDMIGDSRQARFAVTLLPARKRGPRGDPREASTVGSRESSREGSPGESSDNAVLLAPYQGIVPFEGDTVAEMLEHYMQRSEQVPTRLWLAADDRQAFGMLLQRLPADDADGVGDSSEIGWEHVVTLAQTLTRPEMLEQPIEEILRRLFWECPIEVYESPAPRFECSCSLEKVASMLRMLGRGEVESILRDEGAIDVRCEFCAEQYSLDALVARGLFEAPK